jgi:histone-lysine N-methyltransferase SETD8
LNASILKPADVPAKSWAGSKLWVGKVVKFKVVSVSYSLNRLVLLGELDSLSMVVGEREVMVGIIEQVSDFEGDSDHDDGIERKEMELEISSQPQSSTFSTSTPTLQAQAGAKTTKPAQAANTRHKITENVPLRRSERKPKAELLKEQMEKIEARLLAKEDTGLEVTFIEHKGRGIKTVKDFSKGEFVVEYDGEMIDSETAKDLETKYSMDSSTGCFMYYFKHKGTQHCIDATSETSRFGRLVNHSRVSPNCLTQVFMLGNTPKLILVAKMDMVAGTEVLYDYGDRKKESVKAHPWLCL